MAELTTKSLALDDATIPFTAASAEGDSVRNERNLVVLIQNGDAANKTVTVVSQVTAVPGLHPANLAVDVPAGDTVAISPNGSSRFSDTDGFVQLTYSDVTSVSIAAIKP